MDVAAVLWRLGEIASAPSDTSLAGVLGVSPQAVSNWRVRGALPFQRICDYCVRTGASLDFVIFGRGPQMLAASGGVDPRTLASIGAALEARLVAEGRARSTILAERFFYSALVYNRVVARDKKTTTYDHAAVASELDHLFSIIGGVSLEDPVAVESKLNMPSGAAARRGLNALLGPKLKSKDAPSPPGAAPHRPPERKKKARR